MASFTTTRLNRLVFGAAIFVAGAVLLVARPGIALAHHVTVTESGACVGWETKAEYFGGTGDRKVVVDVTINAEQISTTFYFDLDAGHLGHMDYYLLYDRTGSGSLHTSGTVVMYDRAGGSYSNVVNTAPLETNFDCPPPTSTATPTATATTTLVPPTSTATSTTVSVESSATPRPAQTPTATVTGIMTDDTVTPLVTATSTPVTTSATPESTRTAVTTGGLETPGPRSTPTFVSIVQSRRRPSESLKPASPVDRALPATGQGARTRGAILSGLLGTLIAAVGLGVCAGGLRARRHP